MRGSKMATTLALGLGIALGLMTAPDVAAQPRSGALPRVEFEAPPGLQPKTVEQSRPVLVLDTVRGVMGYRLPLVSRQEVPAQVVSGVLIPAHTTYVILRPGYWERVGATEGEAVSAIADAGADNPPSQVKTGIRGWSIWRLFRRSGEK